MIFEQARKLPAYTVSKERLREGFTYRGSKDLTNIAHKVARVMARQAGLEAYPGNVPYYFSPEGSSDEFISYLVLTSDDNLSFRVTFSLDDDSTRITSFELYKGIKALDDPDITLSILDPNINIVQLVNAFGERMLNAEAEPEDLDDMEGMIAEGAKYARFQTRLKESEKKDAVIEFLKTQGGGYSDFIRWASANNKPIGSQTMFNNAKKVFQAQGGQSPQGDGGATSYGVRQAAPEEPLYAEEDADVFEDLEEDEAIDKFQEYETAVRKMAHDDPNFWAMFVYGSPGIGKSRVVKEVAKNEQAALKKTGQEVVVKTGAIAGSTGLLSLLYNHKRGYIVVLDDNDKILQDQSAANYLKGALNTDIEDRRIQYTRADFSQLFAQDDEDEEDDDDLDIPDVTADDDFDEDDQGVDVDREQLKAETREAALNDRDLHIYEQDGKYIFEQASKKTNLNEARDEDGESIKDFYFRSRMIFISNLSEVPAAVDDRCYTIDMLFTYEQILELINSAMDNIHIENVTDEMKREVYDFLRRSRFAIEEKIGQPVTLTFRKFRNACVAWEAATSEGLPLKKAKKWAYRQLRGKKGKKQ